MTPDACASFVLARVAELETAAEAAHYDGQRWVAEEEAVVAADRDLEPVLYLDRKRDARHAARWSPARALATCAAHRRIVELRETIDQEALRVVSGDLENAAQNATDIRAIRLGLDLAIAVLATAYDDHPDFREEWRTTAWVIR